MNAQTNTPGFGGCKVNLSDLEFMKCRNDI